MSCEMGKPKLGASKDNQQMHYSVGALIKKNGKYLLIDRAIFPFGFAGLAGPIDDGETEIEALKREVEEESGLKVVKQKILFEEELDWNECSKGIGIHCWFLFECEVEGEIKANYSEVKSIGWFSKEEIKNLKLEPVWKYWFEKLGILS